MNDTIERATAIISKVKWQFAKTMPQNPHEYTKRAWSQELGIEDEFEWFVMAIREHGTPEKFGKAKYIYLKVDDYKYWTMGWPLEKTIIINRAKVE